MKTINIIAAGVLFASSVLALPQPSDEPIPACEILDQKQCHYQAGGDLQANGEKWPKEFCGYCAEVGGTHPQEKGHDEFLYVVSTGACCTIGRSDLCKGESKKNCPVSK